MTGTCNVTPEVYVKRKSAPDPCAPLPRWLRPLVVLAVVGVIATGAALAVLGAVGEYLAVRTERDALLKSAGTATTPGVSSTGNRLVWGPPMTVVIRGEQWTVRSVMEEAQPAKVARR